MRAYILLTLTMLFWAGNWISGRYAADIVPPVQLNFYRWVIASAVLAPFVLPSLRGRWREALSQWRIFVSLGVTGMILFQVMLYWGLHYTEAINAVLLNSTLPVMMIVVTWFMLNEAPTGKQLLGLVISLAGIVTIVSRGDPSTLATLSFNIGDLIILVALPVWAVYSNLLKKYETTFSGLSLTFLIILFGMIMQIPLVAAEAVLNRPAPITRETLIVFAYIGVFSSALGIFFWNMGVQMIGPNRAGFSIHLLPLFGAILAVIVLGERFHLFHLAGILLILAGVYISTVIGARRPVTAR